jgi:hypothetical protein
VWAARARCRKPRPDLEMLHLRLCHRNKSFLR